MALYILAASHTVALWSYLSLLHYLPCSHTQLYSVSWQKKRLVMFHRDLTTYQKAMQMSWIAKHKGNTGLVILSSTASTMNSSLFLGHHAHSSPICIWFTGLYLLLFLPRRVLVALEHFKSEHHRVIWWYN